MLTVALAAALQLHCCCLALLWAGRTEAAPTRQVAGVAAVVTACHGGSPQTLPSNAPISNGVPTSPNDSRCGCASQGQQIDRDLRAGPSLDLHPTPLALDAPAAPFVVALLTPANPPKPVPAASPPCSSLLHLHCALIV